MPGLYSFQTGVLLKKQCLGMVEDQLESLLGMVKRGLSADFDLLENGTERDACPIISQHAYSHSRFSLTHVLNQMANRHQAP